MDAQTVFAILVGVALACFSLVMVGYSFFRGNQARNIEPVDSIPEDDGVGIDSILDSIDTLELEYQLGNVTEDQYLQQRQSYRVQVAWAIKTRLERGDASPELVLEQEVIEARRGAVRGWQSCPQCDAPLPDSTDLDSPLVVCPHCNASLGDSPLEATQEPTGTALPGP